MMKERWKTLQTTIAVEFVPQAVRLQEASRETVDFEARQLGFESPPPTQNDPLQLLKNKAFANHHKQIFLFPITRVGISQGSIWGSR